MCVCVCVCVCVRACVCIRVIRRIHVLAMVRNKTITSTLRPAHTHTHTNTHTNTHARTHAHTHTHTPPPYTHTYTHTHTHTHTHIPPPPPPPPPPTTAAIQTKVSPKANKHTISPIPPHARTITRTPGLPSRSALIGSWAALWLIAFSWSRTWRRGPECPGKCPSRAWCPSGSSTSAWLRPFAPPCSSCAPQSCPLCHSPSSVGVHDHRFKNVFSSDNF